MSKIDESYDLSYTQNRELSWLEFNKRVLDEATDETVPLLERLKFLSIFSTNLDEFFMIRVGSLEDLAVMVPDKEDNKSGKKPVEQLRAIFEKVSPLMHYRDAVYMTLMTRLKPYGIIDLSYDQLDKELKKYADQYYKNFIAPILSPQIIDPGHPFPHLRNKALYVAAVLRKGQHQMLGMIPVPQSAEPILKFPQRPGSYIRMETLICAHLKHCFPGYKAEQTAVICVTRNADLSFDDDKFDEDAPDYMSKMSKLLKKRDRLAPVRLEIQGEQGPLEEKLLQRLNLPKKQVYYSICPLRTEYMLSFKGFDPELYYRKATPEIPACFTEKKKIADQIRLKDVMLMYPYHSMTPFLQLLKQSAYDASVLSIKITIYRLSSHSAVAKYLCEAAENGKEVTVLMELRARFDEQNNIDWAKRLEESGCRVIYGIENYKCHSKICLITYKNKGRLSYITQIGTGNYNEKTAQLYTDLSLMTADENIAADAVQFFQNMLIGNLDGKYDELLVAPNEMKNKLLRLIDQEAVKGSQGRIFIKANSITERDMIDHLAYASQCGAQITMVIRGICCILPGIGGKTDNITITSIVGRLLEHSRIYAFGEGPEMKLYISSADLMTRNQTRRVEIACPVLDPDIRKMLLDYMDLLLSDTAKGRQMKSDGTYTPIYAAKDKTDSQDLLLRHAPKLPRPLQPKSFIKSWFSRLFHK